MSFDHKAFKLLTDKTHTEQAIWFLNGFWNDGAEANAEFVWEATHFMMELQMGIKILYGKRSHDDDVKEGNDVDQFQAHQLLEHFGEVKTATELRRELKTIDVDKNNRLCLTEYFLFKYGKTPTQVINAPQGEQTPAQIAALEACEAKLSQLSVDLDIANDQEQKSAAALAESIEADKKMQIAEAKVKAALEEVKAEEARYHKAMDKEQKVIDDPSAGIVALGRAKSNLKGLQEKDPLPLSRAKITQEAAVKKAKKSTRKAGKARSKAQAAAMAAAAAKRDVEATLAETQALFAELKSQMGDGMANGKIWWMERTMKEIKKFMPRGAKMKKRR